jgi:hypothetical protein
MRSVGWVGVGLVCCTVLVEVRGQQLAPDIGAGLAYPAGPLLHD